MHACVQFVSSFLNARMHGVCLCALVLLPVLPEPEAQSLAGLLLPFYDFP